MSHGQVHFWLQCIISTYAGHKLQLINRGAWRRAAPTGRGALSPSATSESALQVERPLAIRAYIAFRQESIFVPSILVNATESALFHNELRGQRKKTSDSLML